MVYAVLVAKHAPTQLRAVEDAPAGGNTDSLAAENAELRQQIRAQSAEIQGLLARLRQFGADAVPAEVITSKLGKTAMRLRADKVRLGSDRVHLRDGVWLDARGHDLVRGDERITLAASEYLVLAGLVLRRGRRVSGERLAAFVWGEGVELLTTFHHLCARVTQLRHKLTRLGVGECLPRGHNRGYVLLTDAAPC